MNEQLLHDGEGLPGAGGQADTARGRGACRQPMPRRLRGGAGFDDFESWQLMCGTGSCCCVCFVLLLFFCVKSLQPNQYGILKNSITQSIDPVIYQGGIHVTFPWKSFMEFPTTKMTLEFSSDSHGDQAPINTRTSGAARDQGEGAGSEGGGQPISITCALQYTFIKENLTNVYLSFGSYEAARARYLLLAGNMVSNKAQEFTPQQFWLERDTIAKAFLKQINETLMEKGWVQATNFQLLKIDFAPTYEESITAIQVATQQFSINKQAMGVQEVNQSISVEWAYTQAEMANISAGGEATAKEIRAHAQKRAFNMQQTMKAKKYRELNDALGFDKKHLEEYFKIKSLQVQTQKSRVVVGLPQVGAAPPKTEL